VAPVFIFLTLISNTHPTLLLLLGLSGIALTSSTVFIFHRQCEVRLIRLQV
jgi:hypothetical protein